MKVPIKFTPDRSTTITVADLIETLKGTDPDKPLYVYDLHSGDRMPVAKIDTSITEYVDINISTQNDLNLMAMIKNNTL